MKKIYIYIVLPLKTYMFVTETNENVIIKIN